VKTLRLQIILDDNGAIQKVQDLNAAIDKSVAKTPATTKVTQDYSLALRDVGVMLDRAVPGAAQFTTAIDRLATASSSGISELALLAGAATATVLAFAGMAYAVVSAVNAEAEHANSLENLSRATGIALPQLQAIGFVAKDAGISMEELANAVSQLSRRLGERDPSTMDWVAKFGLDVADLRAQKPDEQFIRMAESVSQMDDANLKASAGVALFGRSWLTLSPIAQDGIRNLIAAKLAADNMISPETIKALSDYNRKTDELSEAWKKFKTEGLAPLIPILTTVVGWLEKAAKFRPSDPRAWAVEQGVKAGMGIRGAFSDSPEVPAHMGNILDVTAGLLGTGGQGAGGPKMIDDLAVSLKALQDPLSQARRMLDAFRTESMIPLSAAAQTIAQDMKLWGKSNGEIADTLRSVDSNANITEKTVARYFASVQNAAIADQAWGDAAKAAATAHSEGFAQQVAVELAGHETRIKLINDEVRFQADKDALMEAEAIRSGAALASIDHDAQIKLRTLHEETDKAIAIQRNSHFSTLHDQQVKALDIEMESQITATNRLYSKVDDMNAANLDLWRAYWAKRITIEEQGAAKINELVVENMNARIANLAAQGFNATGGELNDPVTKAYRERMAALADLTAREKEGIDVSEIKLGIENKYIAAIQATDGVVAKVAGTTETLTGKTTALASANNTAAASFQAVASSAAAMNSAVLSSWDLFQHNQEMARQYAAMGVIVSNVGVVNPSHFATGAVVDKPTLAWVGEGGEREYVIPESKMGAMGGGTIHVDARGAMFPDSLSMDRFIDKLAQKFGARASRSGKF